MKCSAALTNSSSSTCSDAGSTGDSTACTTSGSAGAVGGSSSATNSELNAPENASCVAFATCFSLSMFSSGSTGSEVGTSGRATVLDMGGGTGSSAGDGSELAVGSGTGSGSETGSATVGGGASCSTDSASATGGVGSDVFSGTSTLAAAALPLARLAMGITWPTTSKAAPNSLSMATKASTEASTLLSRLSKEVMYLTTSSLEPVWKATAKSFIIRMGSAKRSSALRWSSLTPPRAAPTSPLESGIPRARKSGSGMLIKPRWPATR